MSAKIYSGIEGLEPPELDFTDYKKYEQESEKYVDKLRKACQANSTDKIAGQTIRFGVADGYAMYMVYGVKPLELIHVNAGDGYHADLVELLTVTKVRELVERERKLQELFGNKNQ